MSPIIPIHFGQLFCHDVWLDVSSDAAELIVSHVVIMVQYIIITHLDAFPSPRKASGK